MEVLITACDFAGAIVRRNGRTILILNEKLTKQQREQVTKALTAPRKVQLPIAA